MNTARCLALLAFLPALAGRSRTQPAPRFVNPPGLSAPRGYSHLVVVPAGSRMVYISGQVALDRDGKLVGAGDFRKQAEQVFDNLKAALADAGGAFTDVVKLNFYVTDRSRLADLRDVRDHYVNTEHPPASTLVEVSGLFRDDILIEVEAVAAVPESKTKP